MSVRYGLAESGARVMLRGRDMCIDTHAHIGMCTDMRRNAKWQAAYIGITHAWPWAGMPHGVWLI